MDCMLLGNYWHCESCRLACEVVGRHVADVSLCLNSFDRIPTTCHVVTEEGAVSLLVWGGWEKRSVRPHLSSDWGEVSNAVMFLVSGR